MKKVLLSGFKPFGGETINPALEAVKELAVEKMRNVDLIIVQLPVVFDKAYHVLNAKIEEEKPDLILSVGQAGGSQGISIERVGLNIADARIADNEGKIPSDKQIIPNGSVAYFTTINTRETVIALKNAGIPAELSYSAGTYVCNNLIYGVLHFLKESNNNTKYGFIHVPYLPEQVASKNKVLPSMSLETIKKAIRVAIAVNLK
jgi:pyroglutamyl-peptidase